MNATIKVDKCVEVSSKKVQNYNFSNKKKHLLTYFTETNQNLVTLFYKSNLRGVIETAFIPSTVTFTGDGIISPSTTCAIMSSSTFSFFLTPPTRTVILPAENPVSIPSTIFAPASHATTF